MPLSMKMNGPKIGIARAQVGVEEIGERLFWPKEGVKMMISFTLERRQKNRAVSF